MKYEGAIYGVGRNHNGRKIYFDTGRTSREWDAMEAKIEKLERENIALREDKERLDWLEQSHKLWEGKDWLMGPEFISRAAIDAARKETGADAIMRQHLSEGGTPT